MIRYISRHKLDVEKYDLCVENAINSRIYVFSWYLDIVADNWDALILNDYEAVMPLPWRSKYFIKYVYPPVWTQQLGVFSVNAINEPLVRDFIKAIPRKFKKITIQFNSGNPIRGKNVTEKVNYILPLDKTYKELFKEFNNNRKRVFNKLEVEKYWIDKEVSDNEFFNFYLNEPKNYQLIQKQITTIKTLIKTNNKAVYFWGIRIDEKLIASLVWLKDANRITYILPIATKEAKVKGLPTLLISNLIQEHQNSNFILDFEGSMIPGVADFFKSFGAEQEIYYLYKRPFRYFL